MKEIVPVLMLLKIDVKDFTCMENLAPQRP